MQNTFVASYIAHSVVSTIEIKDVHKPRELTVYLTEGGLIERSFEPNYPNFNGVPLVGANTFKVRLNIDEKHPDVAEAIFLENSDLYKKALCTYTLQQVFDAAIIHLAKRKVPDILQKAAMSQLLSVVDVQQRITNKPGPTNAIH